MKAALKVSASEASKDLVAHYAHQSVQTEGSPLKLGAASGLTGGWRNTTSRPCGVVLGGPRGCPFTRGWSRHGKAGRKDFVCEVATHAAHLMIRRDYGT